MQKLTDKVTRFDALTDLLSMWQDATLMIRNQSFVNGGDLERIKDIENAIYCLERTINGLSGYTESTQELRMKITKATREGEDLIRKEKKRWFS
jgi:hypothetical protein